MGAFQAAQRELERQRKEELERRKRGELQIKKEQEQDDIIKLKAKKRSLEMELEAVVSGEEIICGVYFRSTDKMLTDVLSFYSGVFHSLLSFTHLSSSFCLRVTSIVRSQTGCVTFRTRRNFRGQSWI